MSVNRITSIEITRHHTGEGPVLDLTGAHHVNYRHEQYAVTFPSTIRALGTVRSSHGWAVAIGTHQSDPNTKGVRSQMTVAILDSPDRQRQVIYAPGFALGTSVYMLAGDLPFDLTHLLRLPGDPTAVEPERIPVLVDAQWRRVERLHALAAGVLITGAERGLDAVAEWWQLPSCVAWAAFPDIESADQYWDDFQEGHHAFDWYEHGFSGPEAAAWSKAGVSTYSASVFRQARWTPAQAATFYDALADPPGNTAADTIAYHRLRRRWEHAAAERTHTPDQVITAARAGLSLTEMQETTDWSTVDLMAALRDATAPAVPAA